MLPKTEKQMFSPMAEQWGPLSKNQIVLMILPEDSFTKAQWESLFPYDPEPDTPPLLDHNGIEWRLIGIFMVTYNVPILIDEDVEGIFVEVNRSSKGIWDLGVLQDLVTQSDDERSLPDIMSDYSVKSEDWAFIYPSELYNSRFAKSAINYQQVL